jgi:hypothetical protein
MNLDRTKILGDGKEEKGGRGAAGGRQSEVEVRSSNVCLTICTQHMQHGTPSDGFFHSDRFFNLSWVYVSDKLTAGLAAGLTANFQIHWSRNISQASEFNSMKLGTRLH